MDRRSFIGLASLAAGGFAVAAPGPAAYRPQQPVAQVLRLWGSPDDQALVDLWAAGFRQFHPGARIEAQLRGTESALAGLYTDSADVAFIGRELRQPVERMAFEWVKLRRPHVVEVATAGLAARRVACTLGVFVHPHAPLVQLSLPQLEAVFAGNPAPRGEPAATWGELGVTGPMSERRIHVVTPRIDSIAALYFRKAVLHDNFKWNATLREAESDAALVDAVASDPDAIAFGPLWAAGGRVRALALARAAGVPPVRPTVATVADRSYPLARAVHLVVDRPANAPVAPHVGEFLRYVLADEGQAAIAADGAYLPLSARRRAAQLETLA